MRTTTALLAAMLMGTAVVIGTPGASALYCLDPPSPDCVLTTVNATADSAGHAAVTLIETVHDVVDTDCKSDPDCAVGEAAATAGAAERLAGSLVAQAGDVLG